MTTEPTQRAEMPRAYDPAAVEGVTYKRWEDSGAFTAQVDPNREPYTVIMPPPVGPASRAAKRREDPRVR